MNSEINALESKIITIVVSSILGAGFGFLAKSYFARLSFRQSTIESIVTRYLDARDELCSILAECAVKSDATDDEWLLDVRNKISLSYYKFFDYIPKEVLRELICFQACLKDPKNQLYKVEDESLCLIAPEDLKGFCENISTFTNLAPAIYMNLHNGEENFRKSNRVEYQARHALMNINKYFTEENLTSLELFAPKSHNKALQRINR